MTVYELIQFLTDYDANDTVKFEKVEVYDKDLNKIEGRVSQEEEDIFYCIF